MGGCNNRLAVNDRIRYLEDVVFEHQMKPIPNEVDSMPITPL